MIVNKLVLGMAFFIVSAVFFFWTNYEALDPEIEVKGVSELTEWVKLAVAIVTLLVGVVNLRIAIAKDKK